MHHFLSSCSAYISSKKTTLSVEETETGGGQRDRHPETCPGNFAEETIHQTEERRCMLAEKMDCETGGRENAVSIFAEKKCYAKVAIRLEGSHGASCVQER